MRKLIIIGALMNLSAYGQEMLTHTEFLNLVVENHPVSAQANLVMDQAQWEATAGRGFLDPKLVSRYETKDFKEKDYYDLWNSYLKIPTPLNIDLKAGYERNSGTFLNPENNVPNDGLYYAGVSVPLGRGLFLNDNVYQRNLGKLHGEQLKIESSQIMNNLLLDASIVYWQWVETVRKVEVYRDAAELARIRFEAVKESVLNGDKPAIDTTESLIQLQSLRNALDKARLDSIGGALNLNNYTWMTELTPTIPDSQGTIDLASLEEYETLALQNHPQLRSIDVKQDQLKNDKRYYAEQVKPELDVSYNFLLENGSKGEFNQQDYKAGISFSVPLLLRKERSKLKIAKIKMQSNDLKADQKRQEVLNKVRSFYNKVLTTQGLLAQQQQMTNNYERMLVGERQKFDNGESSIFLINSRQNKLLNAQLKLIDLEIQNQIYYQSLLWASASILENLTQ